MEMWLGTGAAVGLQAWGQALPQVQSGILELQHCPRAMLTAARGPKVPFVSLLCCHRHHVAVCPAALKMALPPPSSRGFYPPRAAARVRRGPDSADAAGTKAGPPSARCRDRSDLSLAPELPLPGAARPAAEPRLRLRVPRLWGTRRRHLARSPLRSSAAPLVLAGAR